MEEVTRYEVFLFCHILAVVAWVGADMAIQLLAVRARAAGGQRTSLSQGSSHGS